MTDSAMPAVSLKRLWVLNDLVVDPAARRTGAGHATSRAERRTAETGAKGLTLGTQVTNVAARQLCGHPR